LDLSPDQFACYSEGDCRDAAVPRDAGVAPDGEAIDAGSLDAAPSDAVDAGSADADAGFALDAGSADAAASDALPISDGGSALVWRNRTPTATTTPGALYFMGFDPVRSVSVMAGAGPTYSWDGMAWQQVSPSSPGLDDSMGWDNQLGLLVMPGVATDSWDGQQKMWTSATISGLSTAQGISVHQTSHQRFVTHGGTEMLFVASSQTFALDDRLSQFTSISSNGPPRVNHSMAYDAGRDQVILFGGLSSFLLPVACDSGTVYACGSTWLFDDQGWRQLNPAHSPPPRYQAAMVYDDAHQRIILFGGRNDSSPQLGDTWAWDGTDWSPISSPESPSARAGAAIAYDSHRDRVVLFGGVANGGSVFLTDTWELGP
jgi:hypothetical protein